VVINANDTSRSSALVERLPAGRCPAGCGAGAAAPLARTPAGDDHAPRRAAAPDQIPLTSGYRRYL